MRGNTIYGCLAGAASFVDETNSSKYNSPAHTVASTLRRARSSNEERSSSKTNSARRKSLDHEMPPHGSRGLTGQWLEGRYGSILDTVSSISTGCRTGKQPRLATRFSRVWWWRSPHDVVLHGHDGVGNEDWPACISVGVKLLPVPSETENDLPRQNGGPKGTRRRTLPLSILSTWKHAVFGMVVQAQTGVERLPVIRLPIL